MEGCELVILYWIDVTWIIVIGEISYLVGDEVYGIIDLDLSEWLFEEDNSTWIIENVDIERILVVVFTIDGCHEL